MRGQRRQLEERRSAVKEVFDAIAGEELAATDVTGPGLLAATATGPLEMGVQLCYQGVVFSAICPQLLGVGTYGAAQSPQCDAPPSTGMSNVTDR
jgi:selenophosphate synthase